MIGHDYGLLFRLSNKKVDAQSENSLALGLDTNPDLSVRHSFGQETNRQEALHNLHVAARVIAEGTGDERAATGHGHGNEQLIGKVFAHRGTAL